MAEVSADGNKLTIDSIHITFDYEIGDVVELDNVIVVLLTVPQEEVHNRNVVGIDKKGNECWRIPESPHGSTEDNPYMNLDLRDGELWVGSGQGWTYRVESNTGEILGHKFTK